MGSVTITPEKIPTEVLDSLYNDLVNLRTTESSPRLSTVQVEFVRVLLKREIFNSSFETADVERMKLHLFNVSRTLDVCGLVSDRLSAQEIDELLDLLGWRY